MCGIVGYLGSAPATPVLVSELRCLEYRGYDSAGVAIIEEGELAVFKSAGKLARLESLLDDKKPRATVGIGHTRWATHGIPNDENAHPHMDESRRVAVVHNGIIENFQELKQELIDSGCNFISDTDTEVVAHLVGQEYARTGNMIEALKACVTRLHGAYALGVINQDEKEKLYAVNQHYSLAVGLGDNECYLASDSVAVRQYTNRILRLEQSEIAEITTGGVRLYSFEGEEIDRQPEMLNADPFVMDKAGYRHYLHKEIHEQPLVMRQTLSKYLSHPQNPVNFNVTEAQKKANGSAAKGVCLTDREVKRIDRILIMACGTAYYSGLVGKYILEELCGIPVDVEIASEIRARRVLANKNTLTIAVSQSGETADTLAAIKEAADSGAITLGITNRPDSHLARVTDHLIVTECGIEVSVAATKTFIAQLTCFYLLALHLAERSGQIDADRALYLKNTLMSLPALQEQVLAREDVIKKTAIKYAEAHDMVFVARGINFPIALEGALKLKELSYIHASGYAAGELKHGPIAVLDSKVPVITVLVPGIVYGKTLANAQESRARNAQMVAVAVDGDEQAAKVFDSILEIPQVEEFFSPLLTVLPLQMFSYFIADYLGKDVDQPRNLAKSVTVE